MKIAPGDLYIREIDEWYEFTLILNVSNFEIEALYVLRSKMFVHVSKRDKFEFFLGNCKKI